ncbi:hypothetical protein ABI59_16745 [Acidobacteria bacterium Mor1]|nr:hypothetical protein ABI59_16745 [Acidobacteria bacterium Mor1]
MRGLLCLLILSCFTVTQGQAAARTGNDSPEVPEILGEGTVSMPDRHEFCSTMSRDRQTIYIGIEHGQWQSVVSYEWTGSEWKGPREIIGTPELTAHDPYLSFDEERLYFTTAVNGNAELAFLERDGDGWGEPVMLKAPVNSEGNEYYTSFTRRGDLVFASDRAGSFDLYIARWDGDAFRAAEPFPDGINTPGYEADPFIDPDGRYLIFSSVRKGGRGRGDLYISHATPEGEWSAPEALGNAFNTSDHQLCPMMSADGASFLFTSRGDIYHVEASTMLKGASSGKRE